MPKCYRSLFEIDQIPLSLYLFTSLLLSVRLPLYEEAVQHEQDKTTAALQACQASGSSSEVPYRYRFRH